MTDELRDPNSNNYYRIHWRELKVQEVVDTISISLAGNALHPTRSMAIRKPAKMGWRLVFALLSVAILAL